MFSDFKEEYDKARGPKPAAKPAAKKTAPAKSTSSTAKKTAAKKPAKNMFAAFKDEFDKASK